MTGQELMAANPYRPWPARITSITELTATEKLFEFRLIDERIREAFRHEPGQFVELTIFGVGEAPISISSSPSKRGFIELCVRRAGRFTEALHKMQCGDIVGIRGPFGRGFPFEEMKGHDILLVAGGLGIAPLRSLINNIHDERSDFGKVTIIYGSKNPAEVMFRNQFEMWRHRKDFDLYLTVDNPDDTCDSDDTYDSNNTHESNDPDDPEKGQQQFRQQRRYLQLYAEPSCERWRRHKYNRGNLR